MKLCALFIKFICLLIVYLKAAQVARTADVYRGMMGIGYCLKKVQIPWKGAVVVSGGSATPEFSWMTEGNRDNRSLDSLSTGRNMNS